MLDFSLRKPIFSALCATVFLLAPSLHAQQVVKDENRSQSKPASPEVMRETLAAEFATQQGRLKEGAQSYLNAARAADDGVLAERATRLALLADEDDIAKQALVIWKRHPTANTSTFDMAELSLALRESRVSEATRLASRLIAQKDQQGWRYALLVLSSGSRKVAVSAEVLKKLADTNALPTQLDPWLAFAGLAQRLGEPELARRMVAEVVTRFPTEPRVQLLRASQLRDEGRIEEARAVLTSVEKNASTNSRLRILVANEYDLNGDPLSAARVMATGTQDDDTYGLRAAMLAKAEDDAALAKLYQEINARPQKSQRLMLILGSVDETLKRFPQATAWYEKIVDPDWREPAQIRLANILFETKKTAQAYGAVKTLQSDPRVSDNGRRDAFVLEAEFRQKEKDGPGEIEAYNRGLAAMPDDNALLYARGLAWERLDRIDKAESDLRAILATEPENTMALNALGYTLADRTTRYAEALQLNDRARLAEPSNAAIIDSYGWVLYRLGRTREALPHLRHAFALQRDAEIAAHIAEVLWKLGQREEAKTWIATAKKIDPENRALRRAIELIGV
jgi:tetratricopeptide (TPR) repeat protein